MDWGLVGGITGILSIALIIFAGGRYTGKIDGLVKRHDSCPISQTKEDVAVLTTRIDTFMDTIERYAPKVLTQYSTPVRDGLINRLSILTFDEQAFLLADLEHEMDCSTEKTLQPWMGLVGVLLIAQLKDKIYMRNRGAK